MSNPFRSLKYLPWSVLLQSAAVTVAIAAVLDFLLLQVGIAIAPNAAFIPQPVLFYLQIFAPLAAAYGVGALSIFITARFFREILLTAETIWALIGCVVLLCWIKTLLPVPGLLLYLNTFNIMLIVLGAFFSGKRYWR